MWLTRPWNNSLQDPGTWLLILVAFWCFSKGFENFQAFFQARILPKTTSTYLPNSHDNAIRLLAFCEVDTCS